VRFEEYRQVEPLREVFYPDWTVGGFKGFPEVVCWHYTATSIESACLHTLRGGTARDVSCHFVITAHGEIIQILPTDCASWCQGVLPVNETGHWVTQKVRPWKASVSYANENLLCISVELVNAGWMWGAGVHDSSQPEAYQPYPVEQIDAAIRLRDRLHSAHDIPIDRMHQIGHQELDIQKSDPGPQWPWNLIAEPAGAGIDWEAEYDREHKDRMEQAADLGGAIRSLNRALVVLPSDRKLRSRLNRDYAGKV
jgi:N-acetyl-anhydromuramyl-L-alanine amidase AmpD